MPKTFVLDTNVLLYDPNSIYHFQENNIIIPIIVLEELDRHKKGNEVVNFNARTVARDLDKILSTPPDKDNFYSIREDLGKVKIQISGYNHADNLPSEILQSDKVDNLILNLLVNLKAENPILVTKDINLRVKARSFGITAEDYETGKVDDIRKLYQGYRNIECEKPLIDSLHSSGMSDISNFPIENPIANEYFILKDSNYNSSALAVYSQGMLRSIQSRDVSGISPKNVQQIFALHSLLDPEIKLVTLTGKSGSGKTLLALAAGIQQRRQFTKILLTKPIVPVSNKDLGFLPGDLQEKMDPFMYPFYDNLDYIQKSDPEKITKMRSEKKIDILALPYLRGRSLPQVYLIADEIQNSSPHEVKTIITRSGEDTKIILTGDIHQIDLPTLDERSNGLSYLIHKMKGQQIYSHVNLVKGERSFLAELASNLL